MQKQNNDAEKMKFYDEKIKKISHEISEDIHNDPEFYAEINEALREMLELIKAEEKGEDEKGDCDA